MAETKSKKTLSDTDIATFQRRTGPAAAGHGTDVDSDAHVATDSDTAPKAGTDTDAAVTTDRDS